MQIRERGITVHILSACQICPSNFYSVKAISIGFHHGFQGFWFTQDTQNGVIKDDQGISRQPRIKRRENGDSSSPVWNSARWISLLRVHRHANKALTVQDSGCYGDTQRGHNVLTVKFHGKPKIVWSLGWTWKKHHDHHCSWMDDLMSLGKSHLKFRAIGVRKKYGNPTMETLKFILLQTSTNIYELDLFWTLKWLIAVSQVLEMLVDHLQERHLANCLQELNHELRRRRLLQNIPIEAICQFPPENWQIFEPNSSPSYMFVFISVVFFIYESQFYLDFAENNIVLRSEKSPEV